MGHYRSEMGFEDEDARDAIERGARRDRIQKNIEKQIAEQGVGAVIADLIAALTDSRVYVGSKWERD